MFEYDPNVIFEENRLFIEKNVKKMIEDKDEADEIYQEIALFIFDGGLKNFRGESKITTYLYTIIRNTISKFYQEKNKKSFASLNAPIGKDSNVQLIDIVMFNNTTMTNEIMIPDQKTKTDDRMKSNKISMSNESMRSNIFDSNIEKERVETFVMSKVSNMSDFHQLIFKMRIDEGKTQQEIAKILQKSQSTISDNWNKIARIIKQDIKDEFPDFDTI